MEITLTGPRFEIAQADEAYPAALKAIKSPPKMLYLIGNPHALQEGLAVVGARKATPYGLSCAFRFAGLAAERGITIISGGARGCDAESHKAALEKGAPTVVFLGGGCDRVYPSQNTGLFQRIIDSGGAVVSENRWDMEPLGPLHRQRNRLIAGLAKATLIVEAGLPSGTFTTADDALEANKEVLVVPGAITSKQSRGANRLIYQGATPIVDDDSFHDQMFSIFGEMTTCGSVVAGSDDDTGHRSDSLLHALDAEQLSVDQMLEVLKAAGCLGDQMPWLMMWLAERIKEGRIAKYPSGRYGTVVARS